MILSRSLRTAALLAVAVGVLAGPAAADDPVLVTVDGVNITESQIKLAEDEIGPELAGMPEAQRRRVLVEYLVDNQLMAAAGTKDNLGEGEAFEARLAYYRGRALRDAFFEKNVTSLVTEAEAKKIYDDQVAKVPPQDEVRARHILVKTEEEAKEVLEMVRRGDDFGEVAKEKSLDKGSGANGGDLGYFSRGQMVKPFEDAAFALKAGDVSEPVESQFGWHVIKVEDARQKPLPSFETVKERIIASMLQRKAQEVVLGLRGQAKIEIVDKTFEGVGKVPDQGSGETQSQP
ncbi:MAG: peptidylprolyl isomerase [Hyphomicrobiaceae bacterium]